MGARVLMCSVLVLVLVFFACFVELDYGETRRAGIQSDMATPFLLFVRVSHRSSILNDIVLFLFFLHGKVRRRTTIHRRRLEDICIIMHRK